MCMETEHALGLTPANNFSEIQPALSQWRDELRKLAEIHRKGARRLRYLSRLLGGLNVALAALTATAMYAALNKKLENLDLGWQLMITGVAVLPAISSGLQKEWQITARERGHLTIMLECKKLEKELEFYQVAPPENWRETLGAWHQRFKQVVSQP